MRFGTLFALGALLLATASTSRAQDRAWQRGGAVCLARPAPTASMDRGTGCPTGIDTGGPDFSALDALSLASGPHRYELDAGVTTSERAARADACCYRLQYPPPPPPPS